MPLRRSAALIATLTAALLPVALLAPPALADDDALHQVGTVRGVNVPQLLDPYGTVLSPNGRFLFMVSLNDSVSSLRRGDRGKLTYLDTVPLSDGGEYLAVSPDGQYLYVTTDSGVDVVKIGRQGGLAAVRSYADTNQTVLVSPFGAAVSADGRFLYVSDSSAAGAVNVFRRNARTGKLTFASVFDDGGELENPYVLALSTDGKQLYASECGGDADLVVLQRSPSSGRLSKPKAVQVGSPSETCAWGIGVGRRSVVVSGYTTGVVQGYSRSPQGKLTPFDAYEDAGALEGPYYVARPAGGSTVFVEGYDSGTIVRLHVAASGNLRPLGVTTSDDLDGPFGLSADRRNVYAEGYTSSTIVTFRRR